MGLTLSTTKHTTEQNRIGQDLFNSPSLIKLNSSISSLTIYLIEPILHIKAMVYSDSNTPSMYTMSSPSSTLTCSGSRQNRSSRCNYNYNGADIPIYLLSDFKLIYKLSISNNNTNMITTPTKLLLFNDQSQYRNYLDYKIHYKPSAISSPLHVGNGTPINSTWTFNITESSFYYVALEVAYNVTVRSNVRVAGQIYNTSGLESPCNKPLSVENTSCEVSLCAKFYCNQRDTYLLVQSTGNVSVKYNFVSSNIDGEEHFVGFCFGIFLLFTSCLLCFLC